MKLSEAKQLFDKGTPLAEIARRAEVSLYDIKFALGIKSDDELMLELYSQGLRDHEIAARMSCSTSRVFQFRSRSGLVLRRRGQTAADEHRDTILKMYKNNETLTDIAAETGLSRDQVRYWLNKHNL